MNKSGLNSYQRSDQRFLRSYNAKKLLDILRASQELSRVELAKISHLDKKTVTNIVNALLADGRIVSSRMVYASSGRPRELLALNGKYCRSIGIDAGGTHVSGVVMDFSGRVLAEESIDLAETMSSDILLDLSNLIIRKLLSGGKLTIDDVFAFGISFPGYVDSETGHGVLVENIPQWHDVPLAKIFREKYGKPIRVDDCSRLMALAEMHFGAGRDLNHYLVFDLGLGIGCGIVLEGHLFAGSQGKSGELGHMIVKPDGPLCTCGRSGCIESLASGWAISRQAAERLTEDSGQSILHQIIGQQTHPTPKQVVYAAELGDMKCRQLLENAGLYLGVGIANAVSLFNPERLILAGRLIRQNHILLQAIQKTVRENALPELYSEEMLVLSDLDNASALGAALLCLFEMENV